MRGGVQVVFADGHAFLLGAGQDAFGLGGLEQVGDLVILDLLVALALGHDAHDPGQVIEALADHGVAVRRVLEVETARKRALCESFMILTASERELYRLFKTALNMTPQQVRNADESVPHMKNAALPKAIET